MKNIEKINIILYYIKNPCSYGHDINYFNKIMIILEI